MSERVDPGDPADRGARGPDATGPGEARAGEPWPKGVAEPEQSRSASCWRGLREIVMVVVIALVISALVRTFLLQAFWVPSGSMEQTLARGDRILVWKPGGDPGHGDVVVFKDPADWLADPTPEPGLRGALSRAAAFVGVLPSTTGDDLVKRVLAVGGDTIECCSPGGQIIRNGTALDEPYVYPGSATDQVTFRVEVPEGRLFVMGDHRSDSADSRYHLNEDQGTVPLENVVGKAEVIVWPPSRWAGLPTYAQDAQSALTSSAWPVAGEAGEGGR
jgi:signal peptidase I